jgi:hypothetical protein
VIEFAKEGFESKVAIHYPNWISDGDASVIAFTYLSLKYPAFAIDSHYDVLVDSKLVIKNGQYLN